MTEQEIRQQVVATVRGWLGAKRGDPTHRLIVDTYNAYPALPLRNGKPYKMTYKDDWCAATPSAAAIMVDITDIMPVECSCGNMMRLYQALGRWVEDDNYIPQPGDLLMYDWDDNGQGDNRSAPEHVGMVEAVDQTRGTMTIIEGNMGSGSVVGRRTVPIGGRYIRGYCCPDYASKAYKPQKEETMKLYHYVSEMPEWARESATKAINAGIVKMDESGAVNIWESNLQPLVWMDRAGMLDKPAINK